MQNYLPALSYLHMAPPQAAFTHLKCWWNVGEHIEKGVLFLKSLILWLIFSISVMFKDVYPFKTFAEQPLNDCTIGEKNIALSN